MEWRELEAMTIDGMPRHIGEVARLLLIVNVASRCGFTPQYRGLEQLQRRFASRGFSVLGFPCNQFGHQEPDSEAEIAQFCSREYGVSFPVFRKVDVNGAHAHPLYVYLKASAPGLLGTESIKWNFTKFLVASNGEVVRRYAPTVAPEDIAGDIEARLAHV
jgi:glutathione peroxidase